MTHDELVRGFKRKNNTTLLETLWLFKDIAEAIQQIPNPHAGDIDIYQNIRLARRQGFDEAIDAAVKLLKGE